MVTPVKMEEFVELDSPYHHIFIAKEEETSRATIDFQG